MPPQRAKMIDGGRLVLPAAVRRAIGIAAGDTLLVEVDGDELRVRPLDAGVRRAQQRLRGHLVGEPSLADGLIDDRRLAGDVE